MGWDGIRRGGAGRGGLGKGGRGGLCLLLLQPFLLSDGEE